MCVCCFHHHDPPPHHLYKESHSYQHQPSHAHKRHPFDLDAGVDEMNFPQGYNVVSLFLDCDTNTYIIPGDLDESFLGQAHPYVLNVRLGLSLRVWIWAWQEFRLRIWINPMG